MVKKARFWLLCFVKSWAENPVFVYVNEKFCNKNLFLDLFSVDLIAFQEFILLTKMCIEAVVWNLLHLGESSRCIKGLERLLHVGGFGSRQRFSLSR